MWTTRPGSTRTATCGSLFLVDDDDDGGEDEDANGKRALTRTPAPPHTRIGGAGVCVRGATAGLEEDEKTGVVANAGDGWDGPHPRGSSCGEERHGRGSSPSAFAFILWFPFGVGVGDPR